MIGALAKLVLLCLMLAAAFKVGQAFALADPDTIRLDSITRYDDVAQTGDMFILVEYTLAYTVLPTENISQGWLGRLIDQGGGGQLASIQPFAGGAIPDSGYSRGTYGFYFATEPTVTGTLRVTLEGNPSLSPTPAGIFSESITQRAATDLAPDLRAQATRFEDIWNVDLVSPVAGEVNRYTETDGEEYFSSALPNLKNLAPDMFLLQSVQPDVPNRASDTTYTDSREAIWNGIIDWTDLGSLVGVSATVAKFIVVFGFGVLPVAFLVGKALGDTDHTVTVQIWCSYLVLAVGFWLGMITIQVLGIITVVCLLATATSMFLNRSSA